MFKFVLVACFLVAVQGDTVEEFVSQGRWLVIAVDPPVLPNIMSCDTFVNITSTPYTSDCGDIKNVPVLRFSTDDGQSTEFPVVAKSETDLETFVVHSPCEDARVKMMISKKDDSFMTAVTLSNEVVNGTVHHRIHVYGKKVPSFSELKALDIPLNIPYCYQLDAPAEPTTP